MGDEARRDYDATVRARGRRLHNAGLVACLVGCLLMIGGRFSAGAPPALVYAGLAVVAAGWGCFGYAIWRRLAYMRTHPFVGTTR